MSKSAGEAELERQLRALKILYEREFTFAKPRKWRFDFVLHNDQGSLDPIHNLLAVEVEGGQFSGGHRRGREADKDTEKHNAAVMMGWKVLRFTPYQVECGEAIAVIESALRG